MWECLSQGVAPGFYETAPSARATETPNTQKFHALLKKRNFKKETGDRIRESHRDPMNRSNSPLFCPLAALRALMSSPTHLFWLELFG